MQRCNSSDITEVNALATVHLSVDFWSCEQKLLTVRNGSVTTLIDAMHESPAFVATTKPGFDYLEVLFRRGSRSNVFSTMNISNVPSNAYIVRFSIKPEPPHSMTPRLVLRVGLLPLTRLNTRGNSDIHQELEDEFWDSNPYVNEYSCSGPAEPENLELNEVIIRVLGASEWQYIPGNDICPEVNFDEPRINPSTNFPMRAGQDGIRSTTTSSRLPSESNPIWSNRNYDEGFGGTRGPRLEDSPTRHHTKKISYTTEETYHDSVKDGGTHAKTAGQMRLSVTLISAIIGALAIILLIIGCCCLFKRLNLTGSYGIHSNSYQPESSLHLRDSHINTATGSRPSIKHQEPEPHPHQGPPTITINDQKAEDAGYRHPLGQVNTGMDFSQESSAGDCGVASKDP
ncbi:uncharacterized protein LOC108682485 isoform X2 [Hyalella azteca]|nr:uncharacterized protein LOC108682485 isoform X2 [Hyalella azteca]